jgi:polysaccharide export outer membrane protein
MKRLFFNYFIVFIVFLSFDLKAIELSQAQIEQFKSLSKTEQERLAKSLGIDVNSLKNTTRTKKALDRKELNERGYGVNADNGKQLDSNSSYSALETELQKKALEEQKEDSEEELKPFGYEIFANAPSTFAPLTDLAIPDDYILGAGDTIRVQLFGKTNAEYQVEISREGQILLADLGVFQLAGMSFGEMKAYLKAQISEKMIGVNAVISLANLRSLRIFVLGEANKPGPYTLSSLASMTHAIFAAGGISDIGSLRNIQLKRAGKLIQTLDLYDLLLKGDSSHDLMLKTGDVVFIPPVSGRVTVQGDVVRPAIYELTADDTYQSVLSYAGGVLPSGFAKEVSVERFTAQQRQLITLDLNDKTQVNLPARNGDVINVNKKSEFLENVVSLEGAVVRPGSYQWYQGMKLNDLFPSINGYLLQDADLTYGLIIRELNVAKHIEVIQFNIESILSEQNSSNNIELRPHDKIMIFNKYSERNKEDEAEENLNKSVLDLADENKVEKQKEEELNQFSRQKMLLPVIEQLKSQASTGKPVQLVEVDGEVKYPGVYPLAKQGKIKDLILAAGGVIESAFLSKAELTRSIIKDGTADIERIEINLGSALDENQGDNILLQSKDRLNVLKIPSWSENLTVNLLGEFKFPGKYTIRRGEKLSTIISKAGGLTKYAFSRGAIFTRKKLKEIESKNLKKVAQDLRVEIAAKSISNAQNSIAFEEANKLLDSIMNIEPVGRLVLDLDNVMKKNDYDVSLEDGDTLIVPTFNNSVNVIGQVQVTSSHIFDPYLTVEEYIAKSGGVKDRADESKIYIIAANGNISTLGDNHWFSTANNYRLQPGDTIVVPLDSDYTDSLTTWSEATRIIYNIAIAAAAIKGL